MSALIGVTLAAAIGLGGTWIGFERDRAFYPSAMLVIALLYVLFAVMGGSEQALLIDGLLSVPFLVAAATGFRRSLWLVVAALAAHGVLDFFHPHFVSNPGVPPWWPNFCLAYDVVAAGYLGVSLWVRRVPAYAAGTLAESDAAGRSAISSPAWARRPSDASCSGKGPVCGSSARHPGSNIRKPIPTVTTSSR